MLVVNYVSMPTFATLIEKTMKMPASVEVGEKERDRERKHLVGDSMGKTWGIHLPLEEAG